LVGARRAFGASGGRASIIDQSVTAVTALTGAGDRGSSGVI